MKLCLAQHKPFPGYSFYFSLFLLLLLSVYVNQRHTSVTLHVLFPLDLTPSPLQCLSSLCLSDFLPCGLWCHRQRGFGLGRGECAPWTLMHKDPCVRQPSVPLPHLHVAMCQTKKAPKTYFKPPNRGNGVVTLPEKEIYRMAGWRKNVTSSLHLHMYESVTVSLSMSITSYIYPPTVTE